jgi:hypothetical protein
MTDPPRQSELEDKARGNPAGVIYGVLAIATVIAAESTRRETFGALLGASLITMALYWLAHAYAQHLGSRLRKAADWTLHEVVVSLAHEAAILEGAVLPVLALVSAWFAGASTNTGVNVALWCAGVELVAIEVVAALRRRQRLRYMMVEISIGITMGIGITGIRLLLH